jgi:hypothetical protein
MPENEKMRDRTTQTPERSSAPRDASEEPGPPKISVCGFIDDNNFAQRFKENAPTTFCENCRSVRPLLESFMKSTCCVKN